MKSLPYISNPASAGLQLAAGRFNRVPFGKVKRASTLSKWKSSPHFESASGGLQGASIIEGKTFALAF